MGRAPVEVRRERERVLVAMSGGVDSSAAAALLVEDGVDVVGVWMRLHDGADAYSTTDRSCCSLDAAEDARRVAGQLGIPFYVLNLEPSSRPAWSTRSCRPTSTVAPRAHAWTATRS